ncbi:hypothetical protein [Citrobacter sp. TBCS-14]|uniref:hypothetical protein n=1 Tax=Citrobacter sp. TBCS-14 TaxID=2576409 RepID=UPI00113E6544|nr:hypothetical protein [Citrobacter sp. TBCS-14]TKV13327.1 hypothetical protein FDX22_16435 [Citrobacter sp. TBCS-14]
MYGIPENLHSVIKVETTAGQPIQIKVTNVSWNGHDPIPNEVLFFELPADSTERQITAQVRKLLKRKTFIRLCEHCNQFNINGWMQSNSCCQSCAEKYFGVVY